MYSKMLIIVLFGLMVLLQGCNTLKGAKDGIKKAAKSMKILCNLIFQEVSWNWKASRSPVPIAVISAKNTSDFVKRIKPESRPIQNNVQGRGFLR